MISYAAAACTRAACPYEEAARQAADFKRFRPVLMTTLVATLEAAPRRAVARHRRPDPAAAGHRGHRRLLAAGHPHHGCCNRRFWSSRTAGSSVDELALRCLAKSPAERFQSMLELSVACEALLARITASGSSTPTIALATPLAPGFRSVSPGTSSIDPGTQSPTTLSAATSAHTTPPPQRRTGVWIGFGVALVGGIAAIVIATRSSTEPAPTSPTPTSSAPTAAPTPSAPTPPPVVAPPPPPAPLLAIEPVVDAGVVVPDAAIAAKPAAKPVKVKTPASAEARGEPL